MNRLNNLVKDANDATYLFYGNLDKPEARIFENRMLHTAFKVASCAVLWVYCMISGTWYAVRG